jgi:hypothetical protein
MAKRGMTSFQSILKNGDFEYYSLSIDEAVGLLDLALTDL